MYALAEQSVVSCIFKEGSPMGRVGYTNLNIYHNKLLTIGSPLLQINLYRKFNSVNLLPHHFIVFPGRLYSTSKVSRLVG